MARGLQAYGLHRIIKQFTVLSLVDGLGTGTNHFHIVFFQHAMTLKIQRTVERRLPAHGWQNSVRTLFFNDFLDDLPGHRLNVSGVSHRRVSHDGSRIGVHQNNAITLFAKRLAGLGAGIVKLAGLADNNGPGTDDQNAF